MEANKPNILLFKYSLDDSNFKSILLYDVNKRLRKANIARQTVNQLYSSAIPISHAKYKDLISLSYYMPQFYVPFYKNLPHNDTDQNNNDLSENDI